MIRLGVLGSTRGTNLLPIAEAIAQQRLAAHIAVVLSNKPDAGILTKAHSLGIPHFFIASQGLAREQFDLQISSILEQYQVDIILLLGFMRILSATFVHQWQHKILNIHPSLLPDFAGLMDLEVHRAVIQAGCSQSGCTVHWVSEAVDEGPIVLQQTCPVFPDDSAESLKARVQQLEGGLLVAAIEKVMKEAF